MTLEQIKKCLTIPRSPDFTIWQGDAIYLRRWWIIPRNKKFNIYLHHFIQSDDDRANHDHPWWNISIVLRGQYFEHVEGHYIRRHRGRGAIVFRRATLAHHVELWNEEPCWTLFITGPVKREWGFHCPTGWVHWKKFVQQLPDGNKAGPGCDA